MKNAKYIDVHDKDVTPGIYMLLFSGIVCELQGNDMTYNISMFLEDFEGYAEPGEWATKAWADRLKRGPSNCYYDHERMKAYCENPQTCKEVMHEFRDWLLAKGATADDTIIASIWW